MGYVDRNLLSDERILFHTRKHYIIFFPAAVMTVLSIILTSYMHGNRILAIVEWVPWVIALILWCYEGLEYFFSEFAVTNKRVMMREGLLTRHTNEVRLATISQVNVDQSLIGQLLDYGSVSINAFGAFDAYSLIAHPVTFQQCVNEQVDQTMKRS